MKKLLPILLLLCSCYSGVLPSGEASRPKEMNMFFTVHEINDDTATLFTPEFDVVYYVDSEGLTVGERRFFMLWVHPSDDLREFRAEIRKSFTPNQTYEIRRAMRLRH